MATLREKYIRDGRAPIPKKPITSRIMSLIRAKHTKPEMLLRESLRKIGLSKFRLHNKKLPGRPDISFVAKKIAIFVNGCYWHRCPHCKPSLPKTHKAFWREKFNNNRKRDRTKSKALMTLGWYPITVWECRIKRDPLAAARAILKEIRGKK